MSMMKTKKNFPGKDGFVWWTGIVEGRGDPIKTGRVQIRIFGWHTDNKSMIPSGELLWAQPVMASNAYDRTCIPKEGEVLFGFFMDGEDAQFPFYLGVIPNIPEKLYSANTGFSDPGSSLGDRPVKVASRSIIDGEGVVYSDKGPARYPDELNQPTTSKLARNEFPEQTPLKFVSENIIKGIETAGGRKWDETDPDYAALYPYNTSIQSESGHYVDIDDTRQKERITSMHRTGCMDEMRHTGSWHQKAIKHLISLVHGSEVVNIRGNFWKTVERWTRFKSKGRTIVDINADAKTRIAGNYNMQVDGDFVLKVGGKIFIEAKGGGVAPGVGGCGDGDVIELSPSSELVYITPYVTTPILNTEVVNAPLINSILVLGQSEGVGTPIVNIGGSATFEDIDFIDADEPSIPEVKAACASKKKPLTPEEEFEAQMEALLAAITAPGAGGAGATWCGKLPDGTKRCIATHHATSDSEIIKYFTCLGATEITGHENSTGITTPYKPTSCPFKK